MTGPGAVPGPVTGAAPHPDPDPDPDFDAVPVPGREAGPEGGEVRISVIGLVDRFAPPAPAPPRARQERPPGYGVQEQCLPFTAASGLGVLIPAPFSWGSCPLAEVPAGARAFRSPMAGGGSDRCFYVVDDPGCGFVANRFAVPARVVRLAGDAPIPGLSFFDRSDQQDLVKVHLPYVWRTPAGTSLLFCDPMNRPRSDGLRVAAGLVETSWYANPVNLVLRLPPDAGSVHVSAGEPLAQALPVPDAVRRSAVDVEAEHRRVTRDVLREVRTMRDRLSADRSAYRHLVRSRHGGRAPDDR